MGEEKSRSHVWVTRGSRERSQHHPARPYFGILPVGYQPKYAKDPRGKKKGDALYQVRTDDLFWTTQRQPLLLIGGKPARNREEGSCRVWEKRLTSRPTELCCVFDCKALCYFGI